MLPAVVWLNLFGGVLSDKSHPGGFLTVASENIDAGNPDPAGRARDLAASGADVLALVELAPQAVGTYEKGLAKAYPCHTIQGTVGLWSKLPLSDTQPIGIMDYGAMADTIPADKKMASDRALRTTVATDHGPLTVYVAQDVAGDGFGFTWPASSPVCGSARSWSEAWSRKAPGCCRPTAVTTGRLKPESAGEHRGRLRLPVTPDKAEP